jgi:molybdopterin/thiamine biosynthesis adenylyltransferase
MASASGTGPRIAVVGVGAIGCALVPLLAHLPIGGLTLIDGDAVEEGNLGRQPLYGPADRGRAKVDVARERVAHLAPHWEIRCEHRFLDPGNVHALLSGHAIIADCTDDLHARRTIDAVCGELHLPLISGSVHGAQLQVITLHVAEHPGDPAPSLRSYYPGRTGPAQDGCDMRNVPIVVPTLTAALMAARITAVLAGDRRGAASMDLLDPVEGKWYRIAPPGAVGEPEFIAAVKGEEA